MLLFLLWQTTLTSNTCANQSLAFRVRPVSGHCITVIVLLWPLATGHCTSGPVDQCENWWTGVRLLTVSIPVPPIRPHHGAPEHTSFAGCTTSIPAVQPYCFTYAGPLYRLVHHIIPALPVSPSAHQMNNHISFTVDQHTSHQHTSCTSTPAELHQHTSWPTSCTSTPASSPAAPAHQLAHQHTSCTTSTPAGPPAAPAAHHVSH